MKIAIKYTVALLCCMALWGCSKGNTNAPPAIDPKTGKHVVPNWQSGVVHGGVDFGASKDMESCQECHGKDFAGGISKVSCMNAACHGTPAGTKNSPHPVRPWRGGTVTHTLVKESTIDACAACHAKGQNLLVPILTTYNTGAPGCFNGTLCHGIVGHNNDPQPWTNPNNHGANPTTAARPGAKYSIEACRSCHATTAAGPNPLFTKPLGNMSAGCSSTGCHDQNVRLAHPYVWLPGKVAGITTDHRTAKDLASSCGLCHGAALDGVGGVAPSCMGGMVFGAVTIRCHANTTMATSPSYVQCTSCHNGAPSGPNGAVAPNVAGAHAKHTVLSGVTCATCHGASTSGAVTHANGVTNFAATIFGGTFNSGSKTCANTTCHGGTGSVTPVWTATGSSCTICHGAPPNGVSFPNTAGSHAKHMKPGILCTDCHQNAGSGSSLHGNGNVEIAFNPALQSMTGGAISITTTKRCLNVSCHGGIQTPVWGVPGAFQVSDCANCHALGTAGSLTQYNNYYSGRHPSHTTNYALCNECHALPVNHFSDLKRGTPLPVGAGYASVGITTLITSKSVTTPPRIVTCTTSPNTNTSFPNISPGVGECHFTTDGLTRNW